MQNRTFALLTTIAGCILAPSVVQAGSLKVANADITLAGGAAGGYFYSTNTGSSDNEDRHLTDFLVELSSASVAPGVGFTAAAGQLKMLTVLNGGIIGTQIPAESITMPYGWLTVKATDALTVEAGRLATKIGYEVAPSYANQNILLGGVWNSQPLFYEGLRANYNFGPATVFAEANDDTSTGAKEGYVVGVSGSASGVNYSASYYDANTARNILDVIVSSEIAGTAVAANLDFHTLDDAVKIPGNDDNAWGLALYAVPKFGKGFSVPVRLEYLSDGTGTGIYPTDSTTSKSTYTLTVTPTYHFSDTTFVRGEVAYVSTDKKVLFADDKGVAQDNKTSFGVQAGVIF